MQIGFDFDNTIVSYDTLFHKVAREQGVIDDTVPVNKVAVRDFLRSVNKEDIWTEMQGYVYGARMSEAQIFPDVIRVMQRFRDAGHSLAIVSHKTKHPYLGEKYDLHAASRAWIERNLCENGISLIPQDHIYFELTKEDKLARIAQLKCDVYIDDLPEILLAAGFPAATQRFLFDPEKHHTELSQVKIVSSWSGFESYLL